MSDLDPLVERVDALLKRHQHAPPSPPPPSGPPPPEEVSPPVEATPLIEPATSQAETVPLGQEDDFPVLTEIVGLAEAHPQASLVDEKALATQVESAVVDKLLVELDRALQQKLNRTVGELIEQVMDGLRAELSAKVRETVLEAVQAALAKQAEERSRSS